MTEQSKALTPVSRMKSLLSHESTKQQFQDVLRDNAEAFIASILEVYSTDSHLQKCEPNAVLKECLKAATLKLPINKQLGFAYIVPYKDVPQFQLGYKGMIQLAMRSGQYRKLNAGALPDGIEVHHDWLTGDIRFSGNPTGDTIQGYFAYFELVNGFTKSAYMTVDEIKAHGQKFSKTYNMKNGSWQTNFDAMATKTVLRLLLSKYGPMTTEFANVMAQEVEDEVQSEIESHANSEELEPEPATSAEEQDTELVEMACPKCGTICKGQDHMEAIEKTGQCLSCHQKEEVGETTEEQEQIPF